jgi:RNA polymerase sigma factor (sigma-70 family)
MSIKKGFYHHTRPYGRWFYHICKSCWNRRHRIQTLLAHDPDDPMPRHPGRPCNNQLPLLLVSELPSLALVEKDEEWSERTRLHEVIEQALGSLSLREKRVVTEFFFNGLNYREIGDLLNVCRTRAHQIGIRALGKLRHPSRSKLLREFADGCPDTQVFDERRFWRRVS